MSAPRYVPTAATAVATFPAGRPGAPGVAAEEMRARAAERALGARIDAEALARAAGDAGKADLVGGKVPADQLPSYVDDVLEYADAAQFPAEGEEGKIYVAKDTGKTYRWSGTQYTEIANPDLSDYVRKDEMSVTPGAGADADKTTIQLKSGVSATVLTAHQDISGKADRSTTYTKAQVDEIVAALKTGSREVVQALPASGEPMVIYMVPKSTGQTNNSYDEYIWTAAGAWEKIGDTEIDLSGYYQKPSGGIPASDLASAVQTSLGKADTAVQPEPGKGLFSGSYNDLTGKPTIPAAQIQSDWNQSDTTAKDYIKNKPTIPTIPTVPAISTNIDADATSNVKTASPKAVKTFVEGKGYLVRRDIDDKATLPVVINKWSPGYLSTQETMEVPGWPLPAAWFPMRLRYTPDESDPNFIVQAELYIDPDGNQPVYLGFKYEGDLTSWGIFYEGDFTVVSKGSSAYEVGDQWYPDEPVLASYLNLDGTLSEAYGATLVSTAGGAESSVPADTIPAQTTYWVDLFSGCTTVLSDSYVGGGGFPRLLIIGIFDVSSLFPVERGNFRCDGMYRRGDLCYGPLDSGMSEWMLFVCIYDYDPYYYYSDSQFPGEYFAAVGTDTRLVLAHTDPENAVRAPDLGWNDCIAVHPADPDALRAGTYDSGTGEYLLGVPESVNVFDIDQLTDPLDPTFGRSFTVAKKVYLRPEYPWYDPSQETMYGDDI